MVILYLYIFKYFWLAAFIAKRRCWLTWATRRWVSGAGTRPSGSRRRQSVVRLQGARPRPPVRRRVETRSGARSAEAQASVPSSRPSSHAKCTWRPAASARPTAPGAPSSPSSPATCSATSRTAMVCSPQLFKLWFFHLWSWFMAPKRIFVDNC